MGTVKGRQPPNRGLQDILPPPGHQASPHKGHRGRGIEVEEVPHRVHQDNGLMARFRPGFQGLPVPPGGPASSAASVATAW